MKYLAVTMGTFLQRDSCNACITTMYSSMVKLHVHRYRIYISGEVALLNSFDSANFVKTSAVL